MGKQTGKLRIKNWCKKGYHMLCWNRERLPLFLLTILLAVSAVWLSRQDGQSGRTGEEDHFAETAAWEKEEEKPTRPGRLTEEDRILMAVLVTGELGFFLWEEGADEREYRKNADLPL